MSPLLVLIVAVLATSYAGPIVRFAAAPALAIAFWRLALVLPVTGGLAVLEGSREQGAGSSVTRQRLLPAPRSLLALMTLSGLLLALHFWSWIASLRFTTVASSVVLVSLKPVFAWGIAAAWLREHPTRAEAWGIALAVIGASLIGVGDARLSSGALGGDVLALLGALTGAGYYVIGRRVRQTVGIWRYATAVYAVAAAALALPALARSMPPVGLARRRYMMRVEQLRGGVVEAWHEVHVAVVDSTGGLVARTGDPELVTFWRSAAKPFQALPLVEDGAAARVGLTSEELALACASHSSEPDQVARVRELLGKIGCSERDLLCGPHPPLSDRVAQDYQTRGLRLTAVYSNCSGKHAGMLALARHHGWPKEVYTRLEHPVQQRCLAEVSRWTEVGVGDIRTGVDGCGVVCYGLPLRNMALAYARP